MDYPYSPIQDINNIQRISTPIKNIKSLYGKRTIKLDNDNKNKLLRIKSRPL